MSLIPPHTYDISNEIKVVGCCFLTGLLPIGHTNAADITLNESRSLTSKVRD